MENLENEHTEHTGVGESTSEENESAEISDEELQNLDEETQKKIKTLQAQKSHWRKNAVNPETGKKFKDEIAELRAQTQQKGQQEGQEKDKEKKDLDLTEKAYLNSLDIKDEEEQKVVLEAMNSTGKSLEDAAKNRFVQQEIKDLREEREAQKASPEGTGRNAQPRTDSVDYWIQKGELPEKKPENIKLRREIIREREKRAKQQVKFGA